MAQNWMVTGDPLTPATVQIRRQTRVGSVIERYIPPIDVDGATLYVARNKQELREFIYTDIEQAYQSTDLALLSRHVIASPIDQDFDQKRRLLFIVRADGNRPTDPSSGEQVAAWTLHDARWSKSVAVVGDTVYLMIERDGQILIEEFDDTLNLDSALTGKRERRRLTGAASTILKDKASLFWRMEWFSQTAWWAAGRLRWMRLPAKYKSGYPIPISLNLCHPETSLIFPMPAQRGW